jgi:hypothetical protein
VDADIMETVAGQEELGNKRKSQDAAKHVFTNN